MKSTLELTHEGFYDYANELLLPNAQLCRAMGYGVKLSDEYIDTLKAVIEIMSNDPTRIYYKLEFPERHYPFQMSQTFWTKVGELISRGIMVEAKTSDPIALGWIKKTNTNENGEVERGWDEITVYDRDEEGNYHGRTPKYGFGKSIEQLYLGHY